MNPTTQTDLGTPESTLDETVTVEIDDLPATVKAGSTIMSAEGNGGAGRTRRTPLEVAARVRGTRERTGENPGDNLAGVVLHLLRCRPFVVLHIVIVKQPCFYRFLEKPVEGRVS